MLPQANSLPRQLARCLLLRGESLSRACAGLEIDLATGHQIMQSQAFRDVYARLAENLAQAPPVATDEGVNDALGGLRPHAVESLHDALLGEDMKYRFMAAESVLDRTGHPKLQRVEKKHQIELPKEVLTELAKAMREQDAIELSRSDWSYASERPVDFRVGSEAERGTPGGTPGTGEEIGFLHGETDWVPGSGPRPPRNDGGVDSAPDKSKAGARSSRTSEDERVDPGGFHP